MEQIATFHTHFGALTFYRRLITMGDSPVMMPVPRRLSASCGTCVRFVLPFVAEAMANEDMEAVYRAGDYELIYQNGE
jgi:hypothetical protein